MNQSPKGPGYTLHHGDVLDPFLGLGATGVAAAELKRDFIGIEQNKKYIQEAERRIHSIAAQMELWSI